MKVTAFHSADGDCLLVSTSGGKHVLVDGGRTPSFAANTRAALAKLPRLDIVCVSHIDDDHISGVLRLVEDEVAYRAWEFARSLDPGAAAPGFPRPPEIGEVWHNGLYVLVGDKLAPQVDHVLSNVATLLAGSSDDDVRDVAAQLDDLATGERSSMELSRRLSPEQLGIPLNPPSKGRLLKRGTANKPESADTVKLGGAKIYLLGPTQDDIDRLRASWKKWLDASKDALAELQAEMLEDEAQLGTLSPEIVANPMIDQALGDGLSKVTAANLASIMLLVEDKGATALLTGDGVSDEILEGLARHGKLDAKGRIHVDVLKVQHHGATANVTEKFVRSVTADHYVFCGNGAHHNPELEVIEAFARARLSGAGGAAVGPKRPFTFHFTSSGKTPDTTAGKKRQAHMKKVEQAVAKLRKGNEARMKASFIKDGALAIQL